MEFLPAILWEAFLAVQLIPLKAEATFYALQGFGGHNMLLPAVAGAVGSTVGHGINFAIGKLFLNFKNRGQIYINEKAYELAVKLARGWMLPFLALSCTMLGIGIVIAYSFLKVPLIRALPVIALAQAGWYFYKAGLLF